MKLCINCSRFVKRPEYHIEQGMCSYGMIEMSPVTGKITYKVKAKEARYKDSFCGPNAKYFFPKGGIIRQLLRKLYFYYERNYAKKIV